MPLQAVLGLQDPVIFIGKVQELTWHALALKGGEGSQALFQGDPEVVLAMNDQLNGESLRPHHWLLEVLA